MWTQLITLLQTFLVYSVSVFHNYSAMLNQTVFPIFRAAKQSNFDLEEIVKVSEQVMRDTGHDGQATATSISADYIKNQDNMKSASRLLKELIAPTLSKDQWNDLKDWDERIEAAINLSVFVPELEKQLNKLLGTLTGNRLNIKQVDKLIHEAMSKYQKKKN